MKKYLLMFGLLGWVLPAVAAKTVIGIKFQDTMEVDGKKLALNGVGVRLKSVLGMEVNVYAGSLYLEKASSDAKAIVASNETKLVRLVFARSVDKEKIVEAWQESFEKICTKCEAIKPMFETFKTYITDMEEDQVMDHAFSGSKVKVTINKKVKGEIDSADFQKFLLSVWLQNPPNPELRDGMLGLVKN